MYVKEPCIIAKTETHNCAWNLVNVEIHNFKGVGKLNVCGVYRPPDRTNLTNYMHKIEDTLGSIDGPKILVGDINVDVNKCDDRDVLAYKHFMTSLGMTLCNDKITRESSNAILDHVFTNMDANRTIHTSTVKCHFSDHNFLLTSIESSAITKSESRMIWKIDYAKLANIVAEKIGDVPFSTDPNEHYNAVSELLKNATAQATTTKQKKEIKRKYCEWLNHSPSVLQLIRQKNNLYRKHRVRIRIKTCNFNVLQRLHGLEHRLTQVKKKAKENHYEQLFKNCTSARNAWRAINSVVSTGKTKVKSDEIVLKSNNREIHGVCVATEFANYFANVATKIASKIETKPDDSPNKLGTLEHNASSFFFSPIVPEDIFVSIAALKPKKATGIDSISVETVKRCATSLAPHLVSLLNNCIEKGIYPDALKVARVVPVHKGGDKSNTANYRPISVLPVLNTVFERIILNRLLIFLESCKFFHEFQYGFRKKKWNATGTSRNNEQCTATGRQRKNRHGPLHGLIKSLRLCRS